MLPAGDQVMIIHRNKATEMQFIKKLEALHSNFIRPEGTYTLVLKGGDVLKNNWFFLFVDAMKEMEVPVIGFDVLKNFRFNTAKPSTTYPHQQRCRLVRCQSGCCCLAISR